MVLCIPACETSTEPDTTAPAIPVNVRINIDLSLEGEIYVEWDANTENDLVGYTVARSTDPNSDFVDIASVQLTYYRDSGLDYSTTYYYRVNAFDGDGNFSEYSTVSDGASPINIEPPATPANIRIEAHNTFSFSTFQFVPDIDLAWDANMETDFAIYKIYRITENIQFATDASTFLDSTEDIFYNDEDVEAGTTYYYKITAEDRGGLASTASARLIDTPLVPPTLVSPINDEVTSTLTPTLTWQDVRGSDHYIITVKDASDTEMWMVTVDSDDSEAELSTVYAGTALTANTTYTWFIKGFSKPPVEGLAINVTTNPATFRTP